MKVLIEVRTSRQVNPEPADGLILIEPDRPIPLEGGPRHWPPDEHPFRRVEVDATVISSSLRERTDVRLPSDLRPPLPGVLYLF